MEDTPGTTSPAKPARKSGRGFLWALLAVAIAFGAGYLWQYLEANTIREQLASVEQDLAVERFRVRLGQATLAAQAGDFEAARLQMSNLFNALQEQVGDFPPEVEGVAQDFLARRDDIITGLSRSNPAFADVLYGMMQRLGTVVERGESDVAPAPPSVVQPQPEPVTPEGERAGPEGEAADTGQVELDPGTP